jgi:hypothetical protein
MPRRSFAKAGAKKGVKKCQMTLLNMPRFYAHMNRSMTKTIKNKRECPAHGRNRAAASLNASAMPDVQAFFPLLRSLCSLRLNTFPS